MVKMQLKEIKALISKVVVCCCFILYLFAWFYFCGMGNLQPFRISPEFSQFKR